MPKKKQVSFQNNIPGKFIPRDDPPSTSVLHSGPNNNRFNSKMAELLASSTTVNNENEPILIGRRSSQDDPTLSTSPEITNVDSSRVHSKLLHRRIVTMLETLRGRGNNNGAISPPTSPRSLSSHSESKSQPITFGQLRQATTTSSSPPPPLHRNINEEISSSRSYSNLKSNNSPDKQSYHTNVILSKPEIHSDLNSVTPVLKTKSSSKHQANKERLHYSPSFEKLIEQHNVVSQIKEQDEQQQSKSPLTVDEILATYYSKVNVPITTETQLRSQQSTYPNSTTAFYMHSSPIGWNSPQTNHLLTPPPRLLLNDQNRNRPPPPSYSSSVAHGHRPPPPKANNFAQHLIRPPVPSSIHEHVYTTPQIGQHLLTGNTPLTLPMSSSSIRPPPPHYGPSTTNIERSHSAVSSINRPNYSQTNPPQAGFDREFSRLLYGKDGGKKRHQRQKRKAYSDPVKKSVEEAGRSIEKTHRRLTTHLNKTDTVTEEEETSSDSNEINKNEQNSFSLKNFQRQSNLIKNTRVSAKTRIVPPNPLLKQRIPSFLYVYSQASSSNDILLQWNLFSLSELESFDGMMTKLYKDENLLRVQFYENYRALLTSTLVSKTSLNKFNHDDDDKDVITTTAL